MALSGPTSRPTGADWVLDIADVLARTVPSERPTVALQAIAERLHSRHALVGGGAHPVGQSTQDPLPDDVVDLLAARMSSHPLYVPVVLGSRLRPAQPTRLSDVISYQSWRRHPFFLEVLQPLVLDHFTVSVPVSSGREPSVQHYTFNRDVDFSDDEVEALTRLQALLVMVHQEPPPPGAADTALTRREREVLDLVACGLTSRAVARRLGIAPSTVHKHLEHLHAKLHTSGPVSTVNRARDLGLLSRL